jgi:hypothetical protein
MLTIGLITTIFYYHPSTSSAALFFRTVPILACLMQIQQQYDDIPATATFDRVEKIDDKLRKARVYADSDV